MHRLLPLLLLSMGCNKLFAKPEPEPAADEAKVEASDAPVQAAAAEPSSEAPPEARAARYGVPFAWQTSPEEPLARARQFMAEVLAANATHMGQGRDRFAAFAENEKPRATVLACADSRLQAPAWDATPENDDYMVRNLGNQLGTSLGSVEYGVEHLRTPVLLIIGHTGCDAVTAVMNGPAKGKDAMSEELSRMKLGERRHPSGSEWDALTAAVVSNVDAQVSQAVARFSPFVQSGELTVVGAVYDGANHFDQGHGRLRIVNVNSNTDDARIAAFVQAVKEVEKAAPGPSFGARRAPEGRAHSLLDDTNRAPGAPRATVNAVSVLGSGGLDAVTSGTLRLPPRAAGNLLPGTSDLTLAPGSNRYANVGRSPAASEGAPAPAAGALRPWQRAPAAAQGTATGSAGAPGQSAPGQGAPAAEPGPLPAAPPAGGLKIPGAAHDATPPGRKAGAAH